MARADDRLGELASQIARMKDDGRPLWASNVSRPPAPPPFAPKPKPELATVLDLVVRAAGVMHSHQEHAARTESRALEAETRLDAAVRQIADLEARLRASGEDAERERMRAEDLRNRSAELIEKTQAMLNEASERLLAAEWRADQAEESFATLRDAVEDQFGIRRA